MLVGPGAARFAQETGAERAEMLTAEAAQAYQDWMRRRVAEADSGRMRRAPLAGYAWKAGYDVASKGTVVFLVRDRQGRIAAGTSTSGWAYRYPGRLGDSPIIGAGLYADNRYGACGCTHVGEMTIRAGTARSVVTYMKMGATVEEACAEALRDLADLKGGFLGPVMIHAMDRHGRTCVAANRRMRPRFDAYLWDGQAGRTRRVGPAFTR
jgi:L-asparaginase